MIKTLKNLEDLIFPIGYSFNDNITEDGIGILCYSLIKDGDENFISVYVDNDNLYEDIDRDETIIIKIDASNLFGDCKEFGYENDSLLFSNEKNGYYLYDFDDFEKYISISKNILEYTKFIMNSHIKNMEYVSKVIIPILNKYEYKLSNYSLLSLNDAQYPAITLEYKFNKYWVVIIDTNCVTGDLIIYNDNKSYNVTKGEMDIDDFEKSLKRIYDKI